MVDQLVKHFVAFGAYHYGIYISRQNACCIRHRFAPIQLQIVGIKDNGLASQLPHADIKRDASASGRLDEDHCQDFAGEGNVLIGHPLGLPGAGRLPSLGAVQNTAQLGAIYLVNIQKMAQLAHCPSSLQTSSKVEIASSR